MASELTPARGVIEAGSRTLTPGRPAEVVELSERLYLEIWRTGLTVCLGAVVVAFAFTAMKAPPLNHTRAEVVLAALSVVLLLAGRRARRCYGTLRRHPSALLGCGLLLGGASWWLGPGNEAIFVACVVPLGVLGVVADWRFLLLVCAPAAVGQMSPAFASRTPGWESTAAVGTGLSELLVPVIFAAVVGRIALFLMRLDHAARVLPEIDRGPVRVDVVVEEASHHDADPDGEAAGVPVTAPRLTPRQLQVVLLASQGLRHSEIAACLTISARQVARLLAAARERTGSATTRELVALAIASGLIPGSGDSA